MQPAPHIAIVEDETNDRVALTTVLSGHGLRLSELGDASGLRAILKRDVPDLVLMDICLPDEDGFSLARHVRGQDPRVGIIMVSGARALADRVRGLEVGADDYVAKPFEPEDLLARVRSLLRRVRKFPVALSDTRVRMGRRVLDLERRLLLDPAGAGPGERLSASEFALLRALTANPMRALGRDWLADATGHRTRAAEDRSIDLRIARLRRKIEYNPADPRCIRTVRGVGYMFAPD